MQKVLPLMVSSIPRLPALQLEQDNKNCGGRKKITAGWSLTRSVIVRVHGGDGRSAAMRPALFLALAANIRCPGCLSSNSLKTPASRIKPPPFTSLSLSSALCATPRPLSFSSLSFSGVFVVNISQLRQIYLSLLRVTSNSHGCPQILSVDVGAISWHFTAHCGKSHSRV